MIFKNSAEYKAAYRLAVKNCNNIPGLAVLVRSTKNILDFDFYVDLFTGLVDQIDMVYSPFNNRFPIIRAAILPGLAWTHLRYDNPGRYSRVISTAPIASAKPQNGTEANSPKGRDRQ